MDHCEVFVDIHTVSGLGHCKGTKYKELQDGDMLERVADIRTMVRILFF